MMTSTRTHRAKQYIERSLSEVNGIQSVARALDVSPRELAEAFQAHEGDTVEQYILRCRIASTRLDLRRTDLPEQVVMERAGFDDVDRARQAFQRATGRTMADYRRQYRGAGSSE